MAKTAKSDKTPKRAAKRDATAASAAAIKAWVTRRKNDKAAAKDAA